MITYEDITKLDDWYKVTAEKLFQVGGKALYYHHRSRAKLLSAVYPEYLDDIIPSTYHRDTSGSLQSSLAHYQEDIGAWRLSVAN